MKKLLVLLFSVLLCCSSACAIAFAEPVTGSETDRSNIGKFWESWNSSAWSTVMTEAFVEEYERLENIGFNPGTASGNVDYWEIGFKQDYSGSDASYAPWGDVRDLIMYYNALKDTAYSMYDGPYQTWMTGDNKNVLLMPTSHQYTIGGIVCQNFSGGYVKGSEVAAEYIFFKLTTPKSDMFVVNNVKYQNFTNGYIKVEEGVATTVLKKNVNEQGVEIDAFEASDAGVFDNGVTAETNVKSAVSAKIAEIANANTLGVPLSYVLSASSDTYYQSFDGTTVFVKATFAEDVVTVKEIVLSGVINTAYATKYGFYVPEDELGASKSYVLGVPQEIITVEGSTYVNFERGCISWDGVAEEATVSAGYKASATGELENIVFDSVAFIGSGFTMPSNVTITEEQLIDKFDAKYQALMLAGYNLGVPDDGGIGLWTDADYVAGGELTTGKGWIKQGFIGGSGNGFTFGVTSYLVYNIEKNEVYLIRDFVQNQVQYILYAKGAPTDDTITDGNKMQQQFEKGYINAMEAWGTFMFFDGLNIGDPVDGGDNGDGGNDDGGDKTEDKKGCGSVVYSSSAIIAAFALCAGTTLISKKKNNKR